MNRRSFLRGSGLAAASVVGSTLLSRIASAQTQTQPAPEPKKPEPEDRAKDKPKPDDKPGDPEDPSKVTLKDKQGRDYRVCPQCGFNMYKQDRTWSCDNCGYSYVE
jgi:ribosomal protein S27AE